MLLILGNIINQPNTLELHYWLKDSSHSMDAFVQHKCESEILGLIKQVASLNGIEIEIETEAFGEGGLRRIFKLISKLESKNAQLTIGLITLTLGALIVTPIASITGKIAEHIVEKIFEDSDLRELEKQKLNLEIENLSLDAKKKTLELNDNKILSKKRSNFFEHLDTYDKIEQISVLLKNESKNEVSEEVFIKRDQFNKYIILIDEIAPLQIEDATIEIISPVLKKGNYKWRGIYEGQSVSLNMKSIEFRELVQSGKVEFKNGSSIRCLLEVERKINNEGVEINTSYNIIRVDQYFENNKPVETTEGIRHRKKKDVVENQIKLTFKNDD